MLPFIKSLRQPLSNSFFLAIISMTCHTIAGPDQDLGDFNVFPPDNVWKWDISGYQVHPKSAAYITSVGVSRTLHPDFGTEWNGAPIGIPYLVVKASQPLVPVVYTDYGDESDPGPFPIPLNAAIEGGAAATGDRHVITVDIERKILCELFYAFPQATHWNASSGAKFDLTRNEDHPLGWTSADAAVKPGGINKNLAQKKLVRAAVSQGQWMYIMDQPKQGTTISSGAHIDLHGRLIKARQRN